MVETRMKGEAKRATLLKASYEGGYQGSFEYFAHGSRLRLYGLLIKLSKGLGF
jgi:hypothetical protein